MKTKLTFALLFSTISFFTTSAQNIVDGATYWDQDYENTNYCFSSLGLPGTLSWGQNINNDATVENHILVFTTPSTNVFDGCPTWFGFLGVEPTQTYCDFFRTYGGLDLTNHPNMTIRAKSSIAGAKLTVYLGSVPNTETDWYPTTSTRYTGAGAILVDLTLTTSFQTYVIDFSAIDATVWNAWIDKDNVNAFGLNGSEPSAEYFISRVQVGDIPATTPDDVIVSRVYTDNVSIDPCNPASRIQASADQSLEVATEQGGHIQVDPSFKTEKTVVTDMFGRTEEFTGGDFNTQLRGMLVVTCVSGNKVKKAKVVVN